MSIAQPPRTRRRTALRIVTLSLLGLMIALSLAEPLLDASFFDLRLGVMALLLPLSALWIDALDEVAKQAHYWAWYWGSVLGLTVMAILSVAAHGGFWHEGADRFLIAWRGAADAQSGFLLGLLTTPALCLAGAAIFWAFYWLRNR